MKRKIPNKRPGEVKISDEFLETIHLALLFFNFNYKRTRVWLTLPTMSLGGFPPLQLIAMGKIPQVKRQLGKMLIEQSEKENKNDQIINQETTGV